MNIPVNCDKLHRAKDKSLILKELKEFDADRVFLKGADRKRRIICCVEAHRRESAVRSFFASEILCF